jgi:hypothetical protein
MADRRRRAAAAALLAIVAPRPAAAQFFHLQGLLQCIDHPETSACEARLRPPPAAPPARPAAPPAPAAVPPAAKPTAKPAAATPRPPEPAPAAPHGGAAARSSQAARFTAADLRRAVARVRARRVTGKDIAVLEATAAADDRGAVEVLAWCRLYGCGSAPDRVAAYRLYGRAAALDVPHARENQRVIFEHLMTSGERQRVLAPAPKRGPAAAGPQRQLDRAGSRG